MDYQKSYKLGIVNLLTSSFDITLTGKLKHQHLSFHEVYTCCIVVIINCLYSTFILLI